MMIPRLALAALVAAIPAFAAGCRPDRSPAADDNAVAGVGPRQVAAVFTPELTATPPIIVIVPQASATPQASPTKAPTATARPSRTPMPERPTATLRPGAPTRTPAPTVTLRPGAPHVAAPTRPPSGEGNRSPATVRTAQPTVPPPPSRTPAPTEDNSFAAQLRRGSLVVFMRHGRTDWDQNPRELEWVPEMLADRSLFDQCDRQRLLTDGGRDDARAIGAAISRQGFPVGEVLTSQWCRTRETARLAFGRGDVAGDRLFDTGYLPIGSEERNRYNDALRRLLSAPTGGANRFLVGHGPHIYDVARTVLQESEAVLVRPEGSSFKVLRVVPPGGWDGLGNQ